MELSLCYKALFLNSAMLLVCYLIPGWLDEILSIVISSMEDEWNILNGLFSHEYNMMIDGNFRDYQWASSSKWRELLISLLRLS